MEEKKNKLAKYLERKGIRQDRFAENIGVSANTLRKYLKGTTKPDIDTAARIEVETDGHIKIVEWVDECIFKPNSNLKCKQWKH